MPEILAFYTFIVCYRVKSLPHNPNFKQPYIKKPLENMMGKGENAGYRHFLLFSPCFLPFPK